MTRESNGDEKRLSVYPVILAFKKLQAGYKQERMGKLEIERALQPLWVFLGKAGYIPEYAELHAALNAHGGKNG